MVPTLPLHVNVVLVAVLFTAVTDIWKFKVHNVLTLPLLVSGLIYHGWFRHPPDLAASALGALFGFGVLLGLYVMGGMGGGDVKLMAAVGAWLGMPLTLYVFIASSLAAGVYALALILLYRTFGETWVNFQIVWHRIAAVGRHLAAEERVETAVTRADRRGRIIPFAAMIALGTLMIVALAWLETAP